MPAQGWTSSRSNVITPSWQGIRYMLGKCRNQHKWELFMRIFGELSKKRSIETPCAKLFFFFILGFVLGFVFGLGFFFFFFFLSADPWVHWDVSLKLLWNLSCTSSLNPLLKTGKPIHGECSNLTKIPQRSLAW